MQKKSSMAQSITQSLRWEIVNGSYADVSFLTEIEVSQKYGVSKTPAREALNALCMEGLVEKIPRKGYLIRKYSMTDIACLLQFRTVLETQGLEISKNLITEADLDELQEFCDFCNRLSPTEASRQYVALNRKFHVMLISFAHNPYMTSTLANVMDQLKVALAADQSIGNPQLSDHIEIVKALRQKDYEKAKGFLTYINDKVYGHISLQSMNPEDLAR